VPAADVKYFTSRCLRAPPAPFLRKLCEVPHINELRSGLRCGVRASAGGQLMLDLATRKELAALVYERAESETESQDSAIFLADDDAEQFEMKGKWYDGLLSCPAFIVC
jgi:hypothetical protein